MNISSLSPICYIDVLRTSTLQSNFLSTYIMSIYGRFSTYRSLFPERGIFASNIFWRTQHFGSQPRRQMASVNDSIPHEERTATEPRENQLEPVILSHIREVNDNIRLLRLQAVNHDHTIKVRPPTCLNSIMMCLPGISKVPPRPMA